MVLIRSFHFEELIAPITASRFFAEYWQKKPLLLTDRGAQGYADLLSMEEVDSLLFSHAIETNSHPWVRFVNNKRMVSVQEYVSKETGFLNRHKVISGYQEGNTLCLNRLENRFKPLRELCRAMEQVLGHPVNTEVFLTPPHSQGFRAHYDHQDVFIIQLEGQKRWKIYDILIPFPRESCDTPYDGELPEPLYKVDLKAGDLLYFPGGYVHEACTVQEHSLHISAVVKTFTWVDLIQEIVMNEPSFRSALPVGALLKDHLEGVEINCLKELNELFSDQQKIEQALKKIKSRFAKKSKLFFEEEFAKSAPLPEISKDTLLKKREGVFCTLTTELGKATIHFGEEEIVGPAFIESALNYIIYTPSFSINTLPDSLTESGKTTLVKSLMREGLLVLASED